MADEKFNEGGVADINTITMTGNLARDAEIRGDGNVLSLRLASNAKKKQGDKWGTVVGYIDVVMFGKIAGAISGRCTTGTPVAVSGELRQSNYDKDGVTIYRHEIVADSIKILHRKNGNGSTEQSSSEPEQAEMAASGAESTPFD